MARPILIAPQRQLRRCGQLRGHSQHFFLASELLAPVYSHCPVLGGSAAYAVGEALNWPVGLERKAKEAKAFYFVLAVSTLLGLALNFTKIDPIKALVWSA